MDEVWKLLGFNGPAVQVQDEQGRPIAIGLEDLLAGLEKHWNDGPGRSRSRGRIFAQELMKYGRHAKAEKVLAKLVALGGDGEDWLGLGVTQLAQKKLDKAEATLRGAQNLLKDSPFPSLHLAKLYKEKKDQKAERESVERAIQIDSNSVDAWAYLTRDAARSERRRRGDRRGRGARQRAGQREGRRRRTSRSRASTRRTTRRRATRRSRSRRRPSSARRPTRWRFSASRPSTGRPGSSTRW